MPNSLFPLPLAAFEEYMFRDDGPLYPMNIIARLRFAGQLDRSAATRAFEKVVARHPLLRAKIHKTPRGRLEWIVGNGCPPALTWTDDVAHDRLPAIPPLNLLEEHGLRAWASADADESAIVLQAHHAACDGKAVLQIADDFLRGYARAVGGRDSSTELAPCDPDLLRERGRVGLTIRAFLRMLPAQLTGLKRVTQFFMHRPVPLLASTSAAACDMPASCPVVHMDDLEAEELRRLSEMAAVRGVTLNEWLLRDFFLAVNDFRRRHETTARSEWIRVSVPINLRAPGDGRMPAANQVSMVFLERNPRQIADPAGLLESVHEEMAAIRRRRLDLTFILSLWAVRALPGGLARWVVKGRCDATCVLSNLGAVLARSPLPRREGKIVSGNVVLEGIDFFSPVRAGTLVNVALVFYADKLRICLQSDGRRMTAAQAEKLLGTYLAKIRTSLGADVLAPCDA